ncbi:MAG: queuosine precursor transporter [Spirochaetaceae bacterium]|jgi:uncharacterized integral membrane protein (TIGR00697 family)|nr:queuosine precursor transporter [Spirochaetaceae bacterium]
MQPSSSGSAFRHLDTITALFTAVLIISNIASSAKIIDLGVSLLGLPLCFDGGTLVFPLSYVLGDIFTEVYGFRASRRVILTGFAALALTALVFFALGALPAEALWEKDGGAAAYRAVLGGVSSGGIMLASLIGYLAGEFSNAAVLVWMKKLTRGRFLWARTIGSTLAGELLDSLMFVLAASVAGVFPWELFASLVCTNYLVKCLIEALMTPLTYLAVFNLKKAENSGNRREACANRREGQP